MRGRIMPMSSPAAPSAAFVKPPDPESPPLPPTPPAPPPVHTRGGPRFAASVGTGNEAIRGYGPPAARAAG